MLLFADPCNSVELLLPILFIIINTTFLQIVGIKAGLKIDDFAPRLSFFWGIGMNFYMVITAFFYICTFDHFLIINCMNDSNINQNCFDVNALKSD